MNDRVDLQIKMRSTRLSARPAEKYVSYIIIPGLEKEKKQFYQQCLTDLAHVVMLADQKIISKEEAAMILGVLKKIELLGPEKFPLDPSLGSLVLQVEYYMINKIGEDVAGKMHTGRSRIDLDATVSRLYARDQLLTLFEKLLALQRLALTIAGKHVGTVMPGYTHLQHAQPWTFGHYLLSHFYIFERDFQRIKGAYERTNLNPLGTAALAGTSWPLDRYRTMELLGFDDIIMNSKDAGEFAPDYLSEILADIGILMSNLSRLCGDLYVWSTYEFRLIELADEYCGSSSIMPQKKNPEPLECARALGGRAAGYVSSALGILKMCTSTDGDVAFVDFGLTEAITTTSNMLELIGGVLKTMKVNLNLMKKRAGIFWSTASNLADTIVKATGISFRTAYHVVGRLVQLAIKEGKRPTEVTAEMVDRAAIETIGRKLGLKNDAVSKALDPTEFIKTRVTKGSVNPEEVKRMLGDGKTRLKKEKEWLAEQKKKIKEARHKLDRAVNQYMTK